MTPSQRFTCIIYRMDKMRRPLNAHRRRRLNALVKQGAILMRKIRKREGFAQPDYRWWRSSVTAASIPPSTT